MAHIYTISWTESYTYEVPIHGDDLRKAIPNVGKMTMRQILEYLDDPSNFYRVQRDLGIDPNRYAEYEGMDNLGISAELVPDRVSENRRRASSKPKTPAKKKTTTTKKPATKRRC